MAAEKERRKLPSMPWETFIRLVTHEGIREFHNGGIRRRHVIGIDIFMVIYKTKIDSNRTSGELKSSFVKWCKGYVKDGIMYDFEGNSLGS